MAKRRVALSWLGAVALLGVGYMLGYRVASSDAIWGASPGEPFELVHELDAVTAYPLEGRASIRGVLEPGTEVRVRMWKEGVVYADISTVFERKQFVEAAEITGR